jgi:hypothetical protein
MDKVEMRVSAQLTTIEIVHGIKFQNRDAIAKIIAKGVTDERQVLPVCTAINLWVAESNIKGETSIPEDLILDIIDAVQKRSIELKQQF